MTYQLPHPLNRPGQAEALQWILESDKKFLIIRAPTGLGKSALAAQMSVDYKTMVLVLHKSLQTTNYKDQYQFNILYGKSNYPCYDKNKQASLPGVIPIRYTAFDCGNPRCECPYQQAEYQCVTSMRSCLNYAKFLMSDSNFIDNCKLDYLFLDEAHNIPDIVTEFVGCSINWNNEFLWCPGGIKPVEIAEPAMIQHDYAMSLFRQCMRACDNNKPKQQEDLQAWRRWKRLNQKLNITNKILSAGSLHDWYYEVNRDSLIIKPLTAKYHFKRLFDVAGKVVLMSATITPNIASRLGLKKNEFDFLDVPNPWPSPTRLIYDLGGPAMRYESSEADRLENARLIASVIDPTKSGVIHITTKRRETINDYIRRLEQYIPDGITFFVPPDNEGTEAQINAWYENRAPGVYCLAWAFKEGVDLGNDSIIVMAKVPYPSLGSNYEKNRRDYDIDWWLEKVAYIMVQIWGRSRRGKAEHSQNMVFICDSAWHRLKSRLPDDILMAIRKWNGKEL